MISIQYLSEADNPRWDAYVAARENATIYHLSDWRGLVRRVFGHESHYLAAKNGSGEICGVLPLIRLQSRLFGDYMVSMPFFNYGGSIGDSEEIEEELMKHAGTLASSLNVSHVEFRDTRARQGGWPVRTDKVAMYLDLPDSHDELWKSLSSKVRAQVRRPQREGMRAVAGGVELLSDFYRVFSRNMRDLGTPVYSRDLFSSILETFPDNARIVLISIADKPVAAGFLLGYRDRMEIPWASSLREYNRIGVNMALYWEVLKFAVEQGYRVFDFGRSSVDSGTYRFKKQWGAEPVQLRWYYWLQSGSELPRLNPGNPKYRLAIEAWKRMPVFLTRLVGPAIVKNLP